MRHDAAQVSYWLQGLPRNRPPELMLENRSGGPVREIVLWLREPVRGCSSNCGGWQAYTYVSLPDLPPCSIAATTALNAIKSPHMGPGALGTSALTFTDQHGRHWELTGGGRLVRDPNYHRGTAWSVSAEFRPADGCSTS